MNDPTSVLRGGRLIDLDVGLLRRVDIILSGDTIVDVVEPDLTR